MKTVRLLFVVTLSALVLTACASGGGGGSDAPAEKSGGSRAGYMDPPAGSPFAEVQMNSNDNDVRKILGNPDRTNAYMTGKAFIPFYYGSDVARTDWFYSGQGRIVFSRNRWNGSLKVIEILYNTEEP